MKWKSLEGKYYSVTSPIFYHLTFWKFDINKSIQFKFHALFVLQELARRREECRQKFETLVEPKSTDVGAVNLRIKLSNGETLQRIFLKTDTLQVYWWLCGSDSSFIYLQLFLYFLTRIFSSVLKWTSVNKDPVCLANTNKEDSYNTKRLLHFSWCTTTCYLSTNHHPNFNFVRISHVECTP